MTVVRPPGPHPCGSCPYRKDVPSGVWSEEEYRRLPPYDEPVIAFQPPAVFMCHQADGRLCAGWTACHDMGENLGLRLAASIGLVDDRDIDEILDYETTTPVFGSGREACEHGLREVEAPGDKAFFVIAKLERKRKSP